MKEQTLIKSTSVGCAGTASEARANTILFVILIGLALLVSINIGVRTITHESIPDCGETCDTVLGSAWSKVLGLPVSWLGTASYGTLLVCSFFRNASAINASAFFAALILVASCSFVVLQVFVMHSICLWCMTCHVLASAGALLHLTSNWSRGRSWIVNFRPFLYAAGAVLVFFLLQLIFPHTEKDRVVIIDAPSMPASGSNAEALQHRLTAAYRS